MNQRLFLLLHFQDTRAAGKLTEPPLLRLIFAGTAAAKRNPMSRANAALGRALRTGCGGATRLYGACRPLLRNQPPPNPCGARSRIERCSARTTALCAPLK